MAISIHWPSKVIHVPQSDLTPLGGGLYELDIDEFRLTLRSLEDDEEGMPFLRTHKHDTESTLGGITYARKIEIINGYTVTFEDGQYAVQLVGANSNIGDVINVNQVSVRTNNAAGLIVYTEGGSIPTVPQIVAGVWATEDTIKPGMSAKEAMTEITDFVENPPAAQVDIAAVVDGLLNTDDSIETGFNVGQALRLLLSTLIAKSSSQIEGSVTTKTFRDINDTKDRITGTITETERTSEVLDKD